MGGGWEREQQVEEMETEEWVVEKEEEENELEEEVKEGIKEGGEEEQEVGGGRAEMGLRSDGPRQNGADITSVSMVTQEARRWLAAGVWLTGRVRERKQEGARDREIERDGRGGARSEILQERPCQEAADSEYECWGLEGLDGTGGKRLLEVDGDG